MGYWLQRAVSRFFKDEAKFIARHPLLFLVVPLLITGGFAYAIFEYKEQLTLDADVARLFVPENVPSAANVKKMTRYFQAATDPRENSFLVQGSKGHVTIQLTKTNTSDKANMLTFRTMQRVQALVQDIKSLEAELYGAKLRYSLLCVRDHGLCSLDHPILNNVDIRNQESYRQFLKYPFLHANSTSFNNALYFGGATVDRVGVLVSCSAIRLPYSLKYSNSDEQNYLNYIWERELQNHLTDTHYGDFTITVVTSFSLADDIQRNGYAVARYLPLLIGLLTLYMVIACLTTSPVTSKPLLGAAAILCAFLAVVSAIGTLLVCKFRFIQLVMVMPFLLISISIDSMFLMLTGWRLTHPLSSVETRLGETVEGTSVSVTVAMLTDTLSFAVGCLSQSAAVRIFCSYSAVAMAYAYVYQHSFLLACMAYSGRRESAGRHCLTMQKPKSYKVSSTSHSQASKKLGIQTISSTFEESLPTRFFGRHYGKIVQHPAFRFITLILYLTYLVTSAWGVMQLKVGLTINHLIPRDSKLIDELRINENEFSDYNQYVQVVLEGPIPYYQKNVAYYLLNLYADLTTSTSSSRYRFWLEEYSRSGLIQYGSEKNFMNGLAGFLRNERQYLADLSFSPRIEGESRKIVASKMVLLLKNATSSGVSRIFKRMNSIFKRARVPGFLFHDTFLILEQEDRTIYDTVQNLGVAVGTVALMSTIFIFNFIGSLLAGLSIISINYGVIGFLALWQVHLDLISMLTMIMSVGLSADYVVHIILHHFAPSNLGVDDDSIFETPINNALRHVGTPLLQSAASTLLGVACLAFVKAYMVEAFLKTIILVVLFGLFHGLLILPVVLSLLVTYPGPGKYVSRHYREVKRNLTTQVTGHLPLPGQNVMRRLKSNPSTVSGYPSDDSGSRRLHPITSSDPSSHISVNSQKLTAYWLLLSKAKESPRAPRETISGPARKASDLYGFLKMKFNEQDDPRRPYRRPRHTGKAVPQLSIDLPAGNGYDHGWDDDLFYSSDSETLSARSKEISSKELLFDSPPASFYSRPTPINSWRHRPGPVIPPAPRNVSKLSPNIYMKQVPAHLLHQRANSDAAVQTPSKVFQQRPLMVDIPGESVSGKMVQIMLRGSNLGSRQDLAKSVSDWFLNDEKMSVAESDKLGVVDKMEKSFSTFKSDPQ